jgi:hypothetical protein
MMAFASPSVTETMIDAITLGSRMARPAYTDNAQTFSRHDGETRVIHRANLPSPRPETGLGVPGSQRWLAAIGHAEPSRRFAVFRSQRSGPLPAAIGSDASAVSATRKHPRSLTLGRAAASLSATSLVGQFSMTTPSPKSIGRP